jgi:hypothetical protein
MIGTEAGSVAMPTLTAKTSMAFLAHHRAGEGSSGVGDAMDVRSVAVIQLDRTPSLLHREHRYDLFGDEHSVTDSVTFPDQQELTIKRRSSSLHDHEWTRPIHQHFGRVPRDVRVAFTCLP